jgi:hypothetical protein
VRKANIFFTFAALVATLPGVLVGVMVAANLSKIYPTDANTFGTLLSYFMDQGGFAEFVAVLASCSAIAAIMSTADSAIMGVTNVLSMDFFKNWLFIKKPALDTERNNHIFARLISLVICLIGVCVALYDKDLNDPGAVCDGCVSSRKAFSFVWPQPCLHLILAVCFRARRLNLWQNDILAKHDSLAGATHDISSHFHAQSESDCPLDWIRRRLCDDSIFLWIHK